ncbi:CTP synthase (glutamine hydrolyzing) [Malassezia sp. CBS 17886]|nr:CTP synthase (glutamine hydrolyzing) [Malassezia sp. CBS 17886]
MKYIVVSGGVISGIGKGVIASSTGLLLKTLGLRVTAIKIDPYMNIDAGTMAPTEHGEVFVLNDGGEADLDLGNYERYLNVTLSRDNNITTGKIYRQVIEKERRGDYLGKTVQIVPHLTDAIQDWIERVAKIPVDDSDEEPNVCIVELGGTVGDIESAPFVEALRQFQFRVGHENFVLIHVSLVPVINGEQKTKPTQAAIRELRGLGLVPDMIAARCAAPLEHSVIKKLSMFCHVAPDQVLGVHDVGSTYHVPLLLETQGMIRIFERRLNLHLDRAVSREMRERGSDLRRRWKDLTAGQERIFETVEIVLVGKYTALQDSYMSVVKALEHASLRCHRKLVLNWVESSALEPQTEVDDPVKYHQAWQLLCSSKGIIVPGGFGKRGSEGMVHAVRWAREKNVPFLGICLGFQMAVIEFARHVCGMEDAGSEELDTDCPNPVIVYMPEISKTHLGGTMRLGLRPTLFAKGTEQWSKIRRLYGDADVIWERHRHRYEVNPARVAQIEAGDGGEVSFQFIGRNEKGNRMQVAELKNHPYFVGMQAHPELASRPLNPSPPFLGLVAAAAGVLDEQMDIQMCEFRPPHPQSSMVLEADAELQEVDL